MPAKKVTTKQDLENKIAELESKLNKLSRHLEVNTDDADLSQVKLAKVKPKGVLPKGFDVTPTDAPKAAETKTQLSTTITAGSMIL